MSLTIEIGTWHEPATREFTHCPSYYAADSETLRVPRGDYPARLTFEGGYTIPMPYWLLVGIDCERVRGRLYSGFGGSNFASTELTPGETVRYVKQMYRHEIGDFVRDGKLTLKPQFAWLADWTWDHPGAPKTWDQVRALAS